MLRKIIKKSKSNDEVRLHLIEYAISVCEMFDLDTTDYRDELSKPIQTNMDLETTLTITMPCFISLFSKLKQYQLHLNDHNQSTIFEINIITSEISAQICLPQKVYKENPMRNKEIRISLLEKVIHICEALNLDAIHLKEKIFYPIENDANLITNLIACREYLETVLSNLKRQSSLANKQLKKINLDISQIYYDINFRIALPTIINVGKNNFDL